MVAAAVLGASVAAAIGVSLFGCYRYGLGIRKVDIPMSISPKQLQTQSKFGYKTLSDILSDIVDENGKINYGLLMKPSQLGRLHRWVSTIAVIGPNSTPQLFESKSERLAYYINAYNALVLFAVTQHYPMRSVMNVRSTVEIKNGFGFFYAPSYGLDQSYINLYDLENSIIRQIGDARIHAAINCASIGCPNLQSFVFSSDKSMLESQLNEVTTAFVTDSKHFHIDILSKSVHFSSIFQWYIDDFVDFVCDTYDLNKADISTNYALLKFVSHFSKDCISNDDIQTLQTISQNIDTYSVVFMDYDWRLNKQT